MRCAVDIWKKYFCMAVACISCMSIFYIHGDVGIEGYAVGVISLFVLLQIPNICVYIVFSVSIIIQMVCYYLYGGNIQSGIVASVMETDIDEFLGFCSVVGYDSFAVLFLCILLFGILRKISIQTKYSYILLLFICLAPLFHIPFNKGDLIEFISYPSEYVCDLYKTRIVFRPYALIAEYVIGMQKVKRLITLEKKLPEGVQATNKLEGINTVILVIGESDSKYHHSSYGYPVKTDPFISSLSSEKCKKYDAISPASITRNSVIRILSFATPKNIAPFYENYNIVDIANSVNFDTHWVSAQAKVGLNDYLIYSISKSSKNIYFDPYRNDFNLVEYLEKNIDVTKRQFFIVHIGGSHMPYKYDKFDYEKMLKDKNVNMEYIDYDASIYHTDRFLSMINKFANNSVLFMYLSDHGEIVNAGHGIPNEGFSVFDVPFYIWSSNCEVMKEADSIIEKYAKNIKVNLSSLAYIMSEIFGFEVEKNILDRCNDESLYVYGVDNNVYTYTAK